MSAIAVKTNVEECRSLTGASTLQEFSDSLSQKTLSLEETLTDAAGCLEIINPVIGGLQRQLVKFSCILTHENNLAYNFHESDEVFREGFFTVEQEDVLCMMMSWIDGVISRWEKLKTSATTITA